MNAQSIRIVALCTILAASASLFWVLPWIQEQKTKREAMLKTAEREAFQLGSIIMTLRSEGHSWPTNLCVTNVPVAKALLDRTLRSDSVGQQDDGLVDPWGNPYHMTLRILPLNPHVEALLHVWSFGPDKTNNQGEEDDVSVRITAPNQVPEDTAPKVADPQP
jgi:hypothetical protein